jgi:hypothetical protein
MSIWDKFPNYSPEELRDLTAAAAAALIDAAPDAGVTAGVLKVSTRSAAAQLLPLLQPSAPGIQREQIQTALEDPETAQKMAVAVLGEIRSIPGLAQAVADAYEDRRREMAGPELLLAGAAVILAIKVKDLSFSKDGIKASFYEAGEAVKTFVADLVKSVKPGV